MNYIKQFVIFIGISMACSPLSLQCMQQEEMPSDDIEQMIKQNPDQEFTGPTNFRIYTDERAMRKLMRARENADREQERSTRPNGKRKLFIITE